MAFEWMGDTGNIWGSILTFIGAMLAAGGGLGQLYVIYMSLLFPFLSFSLMCFCCYVLSLLRIALFLRISVRILYVTHTHTHLHYSLIHARVCMHTHSPYIHTHTHIYIHIYIHNCVSRSRLLLRFV